MELRPVFYFNEWLDGDLEALKRLSELNWPILIDAQELQKSQNPEAILESIPKDQLHIISAEVEEDLSIFSRCVSVCGKEGWTHLIHVNQYSEAIVAELLESKKRILENPWARIALVPEKRETHTNNAFMQRLFDLGERDYRNLKSQVVIYPIFYIQDRIFKKSDSFIHEKLLVHCLRGECEHLSVPVDYEEKNRKTSWLFAWQNSIFNWSLVALTSLQNSTRPIHSSLSLAMGVFVACTPFYGVQTTLIIIFAFVFRLSFPIAFLGSQVSLPPIYALIVPLQVYIGFKMTGRPLNFEGRWLEMAQNHFTSWLLGSVVVGGVLAAILGGAWFLLQRKPTRSKVNWSGNMRGGRFANYIMSRIIKWGGLSFAYFILLFIVPYFYIFSPKARRGLNEYYNVIDKKTNWLKRQLRVVKHLYRFAQVLVDQVYQAHFKELVFDISYRGGEIFVPLPENKSQILIFSHFGGWGLTAQGFSRKNIDRTITLIRYRSTKISTESVVRESQSDKIRNIYFEPGEPIYMGMHDVLSKGHDMVLMGDRPVDNNFEILPFLGRIAPFPSTPFRLAKTYNVNLKFVLGFKDTKNSYGLVSKTIDTSQMTFKEAMQEYVSFLEKTLRDHPQQWFNHFNYWSSRPSRPDGSLCQPNRYQFLSLKK